MCGIICDLVNKHSNSTVWIGGDLNLPDIDWSLVLLLFPRAINFTHIALLGQCDCLAAARDFVLCACARTSMHHAGYHLHLHTVVTTRLKLFS